MWPMLSNRKVRKLQADDRCKITVNPKLISFSYRRCIRDPRRDPCRETLEVVTIMPMVANYGRYTDRQMQHVRGAELKI